MSRTPAGVYDDPQVVAFYAGHDRLQAAEVALFAEYVRPGLDVLDLGVGGGRTTPYLARGARRYLGLDSSQAMIEACRKGFPGLAFAVGDATRLSEQADASFDLVVFSFNGLDCIPTLAGRRACLAECRRVLRPGGHLLVSSHNARALLFPPVLEGARGLRRAWRLVYALWRSLQLLAVRLPSRAYWSGAGYARDPGTHGGLTLYLATLERQQAELRAAGFAVERSLPAPRLDVRAACAVAWYYHACRRLPDRPSVAEQP